MIRHWSKAILGVWKGAGKAAIVALCILIAAQSAGVSAWASHDHNDCAGHGASESKPAARIAHDGEHPHSHAAAPHPHEESSQAPTGHGKSHHSGDCCGWLCAAATLPLLTVSRAMPGLPATLPPPVTAACENAHLEDLFRPPRPLQRIA